MIVFKSYLKILKKFISIIIVYTVIFMTFAIITNQNKESVLDFVATVPDVAIINNDKDSKVLEAFNKYISEHANIVEIANDENEMQDALFFRKVSYILIIPEEYTDTLINGNTKMIEIRKTPDGYSTYMELMVQRFLKIVDIYARTGMNEDEICSYIEEDLKQEAKITVDADLDISQYSRVRQYYDFSNYVFLSLCILIISDIMSCFKDSGIKNRNLVSPTPYKKINTQIFLGNLCIVIGIWIFYVAISVILYSKLMLTRIGLMLMLNSFVFVITAAAIAFLIANLIKSRNDINGIVNIVALGLSFISGAFVPQKYLGSIVLGIAKFFPSYWYITNNKKIIELKSFDMNSLIKIIQNFGIILSYVVIAFIIIKIHNKIHEKE